jgi:hypothetical protein
MHAHRSAQPAGAHALGNSDGKSHSGAAVGLMAALSFLAFVIDLGSRLFWQAFDRGEGEAPF